MPRVASDERRERDALILRLFLAGSSYRQIAKHPRVNLSARGVGDVIHRELAADAPHRESLSQQAADIYLLRLERMLAAAMPSALQGDWRAWEGCRRLLEQQARFFGLTATPANDDGSIRPGLPERDADGPTVLERYRRRHKPPQLS